MSQHADSAALGTSPQKRDHHAGSATGDHHAISLCETLSATLSRVQKEVHAVEERQVIAERRVAELSSMMQGLQEEQLEQACNLERGQKTVAMRAKHALHTAVAVQQHVEQSDEAAAALDKLRVPPGGWAADHERILAAKLEEQRTWLIELTGEVNAMHGQRPPGYVPFVSAAHMRVHLNGGQPPLTLTDRVVALERSQKAVTVSAKRALHTALVVTQQQKTAEQEREMEKCLGVGGPMAELEERWAVKFKEQDEVINKLLELVTELNDITSNEMLPSEPLLSRGASSASRDRSTSRGRTSVTIQTQIESLTQKVEQMESHITSKAAALEGPKTVQRAAGFSSLSERSTTLEQLERKLEKTVVEMSDRIAAVQASTNQQALSLRSITQQFPDFKSKLDQAWSHTLHLLERVREHDVRFELVRSTIEGQKQDLLDISDTNWVHENMTDEEIEKRWQAVAETPVVGGDDAAGHPPFVGHQASPLQTLPKMVGNPATEPVAVAPTNSTMRISAEMARASAMRSWEAASSSMVFESNAV